MSASTLMTVLMAALGAFLIAAFLVGLGWFRMCQPNTVPADARGNSRTVLVGSTLSLVGLVIAALLGLPRLGEVTLSMAVLLFSAEVGGLATAGIFALSFGAHRALRLCMLFAALLLWGLWWFLGLLLIGI